MNKRISFILSIILTIFIFAVIFFSIDISLFIENITKINLWLFILSLILLFPPFFLFAYRWHIMVKDFREISFYDSLKLFFVSQSINIVTPSKVGDFTKAYFVRNEKFKGKVALGACFFEKILDLFVLSIFAIFGILFAYSQIASFFILFFLIFLTLLPLFILVVNLKNDSRLMRLVRLLVPFRSINKIIEEILLYFQLIRKNKKNLVNIFIINILLWIIFIYQAYILLLALGIEINLLAAFGLLPLGIFVGLLPLTVSGMGTRDAAFILLLSAYADPAVLALFGILFSLRYIIPGIIGLIWAKEILVKK